MPMSDLDFTFKFFRPSHRTVPFHNGLLDIRTKHTIAQDRLAVAEQRLLDAERRKSVSNLQLLALEQRQFEKKMTTLYHSFQSTYTDRPVKMRNRSSSEVIFPHIRPPSPLTGSLPIRRSKLSISLHDSKQNLLSLPKLVDSGRRFSVYSDGDTSENSFFTSDMDSGEEEDENEVAKYSKSKPQMTNSKRTTTEKEKLPKLVRQLNKPLPPIVAVIPPEEDILYLAQTDVSS